MNYDKGWTSSQYDSIPDTKNPQESALGFPRKAVWNIARAIGRARDVYARFLFLISELESMSDCDVPLELYARNRVSIHDLKDVITPIIREDFFFMLEEHTHLLFIINEIR